MKESEKKSEDSVPEERVILATGGYDHTIRFWCGYNGQCEETLSHPESQVNAMALSGDRRLLAVAGHQHIRTYAAADAGHSAVALYEGVGGNVTGVVFDGVCMYTSGEDGVLRVWDTRQGRVTGLSCDCGSVGVNCVRVVGSVELLAGDSCGLMHVWDMRSGVRTERRMSGTAVQDVCVDGNWVAAADSAGTCVLSRVTDWTDRLSVQCHNKQCISCRFSPDSTLLVTTSADCTARVWRTADLLPSTCSPSRPIHPLITLSTPTQRWVWDSAFSRDSHYLLTASSDATARLWNIDSGECVREYTGHQKAITALAFSDGIPA